jgi:hypothetical protein
MTNRTKQSAVVGMFGDLRQARYAIDDLRRIGFMEQQIGFVTREANDCFRSSWNIPTRERLVKPIGSIMAGGILRNAVGEVGGVFGGLVGDLTNLGVPLWEAEQYEGEFVAGVTLVVVDADEDRRDALNVLRRYGSVGVQSMHSDDTWD